MKYIIVKYARVRFPNGKAPSEASIGDSYTARTIGIVREFYDSLEEAEADLDRLNDVNCCVGYGIVEMQE